MKLKNKLMALGSVVVASFVLSSFNSVFAQCPPGYSYCTTFSGWCCLEENYCVDPSPPYCQPFGEPSSSTSSISTTTTSIATISITSTSSSILPTSSSSSSSTSAPPTTAPSTTSSSGVACGVGEFECTYFRGTYQYECCDNRLEECCWDGCCSIWSECPLIHIYGVDSAEAELLRKYRDGILSKTSTGREIIRLYYEWSPVIASAIKEDQEFEEKLKELIDEMLPIIEELVK